MKQRHGYTLVEMLAVISVTSILMGIATMTLFALMRNERAGRDHVLHTQSLIRLADRFRSDVHATHVDQTSLGDSDGELIRFHPEPSRTVAYRQLQRQITRTEQSDGDSKHIEVFVVPHGAIATAKLDREGQTTVRLSVGPLAEVLPVRPSESATDTDEPTGMSLEIHATPARDHRFLREQNP